MNDVELLYLRCPMTIQDLLITPIYLAIFYFLAYIIRPSVTTPETKKYFIPALSAKFFGAIALGMIYQFYYSGGDTYNYYRDGSIIFSSFLDSPFTGVKVLLANGSFEPDTYLYTRRLIWYRATSEFTISRISAVFGLFTFNTYSSIALCFAAFCFSGLWALYSVLNRLYKGLYREFAIAIFFIPSVFFWGSGLMKDTIALACLAWMFYGFYKLFIVREDLMISLLIFIVFFLLLRSIRSFMLLAFLPPAIFWIYGENMRAVKNKILKWMAIPILVVPTLYTAYYIGINITAGDAQYDLDNIGKYTKINAEYLYYVSEQQGGSGYYLGELDGTLAGTFRYAPSAVWVALFGPQLWQVNNVVMLLSALENTLLLFFVLYVIFKFRWASVLNLIVSHPYLQFAFIFSIIFAFAIGITSYNYGTLVRYKLPLIPFFVSGLLIIRSRLLAR